MPPKRKAADELHAKVRGEPSETATEHMATRYSWWSLHEGSTTVTDRHFPTRKMALLYCAKRNTEELRIHIGDNWADNFSGPYALTPNEPFSFERFLELSEEDLLAYSNELSNTFCRLKIKQGSVYRYVAKEMHPMDVGELITFLQHEGKQAGDTTHHERQKLLLDNVAGFD